MLNRLPNIIGAGTGLLPAVVKALDLTVCEVGQDEGISCLTEHVHEETRDRKRQVGHHSENIERMRHYIVIQGSLSHVDEATKSGAEKDKVLAEVRKGISKA